MLASDQSITFYRHLLFKAHSGVSLQEFCRAVQGDVSSFETGLRIVDRLSSCLSLCTSLSSGF